jgi:Zn-dependent protease
VALVEAPASGWVIGRVAGTRIVLRPGVLIIVGIVLLMLGPTIQRARPDLGALAFVVAAGFAVLLLFSVLLHELAHAGMARRFGIDAHEISLTLIGGHTELDRTGTPGSTALIAVVGPLTNAAIALAAWGALTALPGGGVLALLVLVTASANGFVAVINLLPGLPLDGGRLLEAAVWRLTGRRRTGTLVAARAGRAIAAIVVLAAVAVPYLGGARPDLATVVWGALLGALLWSGAGPFLHAAAHERAMEDLLLWRLAVRAPALSAAATIGDLDAVRAATAVLVDDDGAPVGYVEPVAAAAVPPEHRSTTPLLAVAVRLPPGVSVDGGLTGPAAVRAVVEGARISPMLVVLGPGGSVYGLLRYLDVVTALRRGS